MDKQLRQLLIHPIKNLIMKASRIQIGVLGLTLIVAGLISFSACVKQDPIILPPPIEEPVEELDPEYDLVGFLNGPAQIFFIDPNYIDDVLSQFEVFENTEGGYTMVLVADDGETTLLDFWIEPVEIPGPFLQAQEAGDFAIDEEPELKEGIWVRTWRNAQCGEKVKKGPGTCTDLPQVDPADGAASYESKTTEDYYKCKPGDDYCKEFFEIVGETVYHDEFKCKGNQVKTEPYRRYRCPKT